MPSHIRTLGGVPVPVVILEDPAYFLLPWLLKPYLGVSLSEKQKKFNRRFSRALVVVESTFGRLKGRWRSLLKRKDKKLDYLRTAVTACCILHNICEVHLDEFNNQWLDDVDESSMPSSSGSTLPSASTGSSNQRFSQLLSWKLI